MHPIGLAWHTVVWIFGPYFEGFWPNFPFIISCTIGLSLYFWARSAPSKAMPPPESESSDEDGCLDAGTAMDRERLLKELAEGGFEEATTASFTGLALRTWPTGMSTMRGVRKLVLTGNRLRVLPTSIGNLATLEELYVSANKLKELPAEIGGLKHLRVLHAGDNHLLRLPAALGGCTSLEELTVSENYLESLPTAIGLLAKLKVLRADMNHLMVLPASIGELQALEELRVHSNRPLKFLPEAIGHLASLRELHAGLCQLVGLPAELGMLSRLEVLHLGGNSIMWIPEEVSGCVALKRFHIETNLLTVLPRGLAALELENLEVAGNPLKQPPLSVCHKGFAAVKSWLLAPENSTMMATNRESAPLVDRIAKKLS